MRPVDGLHRLARWLKTRRRTHKLLLALAAAGGVAAVGIYAWLFAALPPIAQLSAGLALPSTRIYDRDGVLLYEILPPEQGRNTALTLDQIPPACQQAVIATEDENFYRHPGVDVVGIVRALWINVRGGEILAGGSTITQQVARNLLLDPEQRQERTLRRKLREMILAIRLQNAYSKRDVLALYLNQTYFGNLAYGIEGAAQAYFGKSAADLSLAECALLAGVIQNPAYYDPLANTEQALTRQEIVLERMVDEGYLTAAEAAAAQDDPLQFAAAPFPIRAPHFVMAVWKQLERDYGDQLYTAGLEVVTTVDVDWQNTAQEIVQRQLDLLNHPPAGTRAPANANNAAVVAMDPFTGQVLTLLGSPDYFDEAIDGAVNAALALRQPGSALKPFTYAAAMDPLRDAPWTAASLVLDVETPFVTRRLESYTPANFGLVEHGPVLVREALASSYNIPPVVALEEIGIDALVALVNNAGLTTLAGNAAVDLSITLGGGEVRLLDMAQAYSSFPNGGYRVEPTFILSVRTRGGETLYEWERAPLNQRILDERVAFLITDILADPEARIPGFGRNNAMQVGRPAAAKTGTTTDFRDNWIVGFTPNLVVGVWVGNADNTPMADITGVSGAGPIWNAFLRAVLLGQPELDFERPAGLNRIEVCALSGLLPTPACTLRRWEWFIPGTEPTAPDTFYQVFEIDRRTGLLADDTTPMQDRLAQTFIVLPQEARDWGVRNGIRQPPPGADTQVLADDAHLRLLEPDPYTVFELSPITPAATQRIRLTVGVPPETQRVTYTLNGRVIGTVDAAPWALWWPLAIGSHQLTATALLSDGTTQTTDPLPFTVVNYAPPQPRTIDVRP